MIHWDQTCWKYLDRWEDYCRVVRRWWMRLRMIFFNSSSSASTAFHSSCNKRDLAFHINVKYTFGSTFGTTWTGRSNVYRKVKCLLGILTNLHLSLFGMCLYNSMSHVAALPLISDFGFLPENVYAAAGLCRSRWCDPLSLLFDVGSDWHGPCLRNIER